MKKFIEISYEGELRTLIVEGDNRFHGPFFESVAIPIAENREGGKEWHCMHCKFHWDERSNSRFSLLLNEVVQFVEQEEKVKMTEREVQKLREKASLIYSMGQRIRVKNVDCRLIYGEEENNISIEATFNRAKLRQEMGAE